MKKQYILCDFRGSLPDGISFGKVNRTAFYLEHNGSGYVLNKFCDYYVKTEFGAHFEFSPFDKNCFSVDIIKQEKRFHPKTMEKLLDTMLEVQKHGKTEEQQERDLVYSFLSFFQK